MREVIDHRYHIQYAHTSKKAESGARVHRECFLNHKERIYKRLMHLNETFYRFIAVNRERNRPLQDCIRQFNH